MLYMYFRCVNFCFSSRLDTLNENTSVLNEYLQLGDNRNARVYTQILAEQLNRLAQDDVTDQSDDVTTAATSFTTAEDVNSDTVTSQSRETRRRIRHLILETLRDLPQRDEVSESDALQKHARNFPLKSSKKLADLLRSKRRKKREVQCGWSLT